MRGVPPDYRLEFCVTDGYHILKEVMGDSASGLIVESLCRQRVIQCCILKDRSTSPGRGFRKISAWYVAPVGGLGPYPVVWVSYPLKAKSYVKVILPKRARQVEPEGPDSLSTR